MIDHGAGKLKRCWYLFWVGALSVFYFVSAVFMFFWQIIKNIYNKIFGVDEHY